ncbi:hypothetical protein GW881_01570 [Candidatus Roizmanbacteria bacterium]|nr:hypothetical protein [Candidatus Roizmanbacteria bacterium]
MYRDLLSSLPGTCHVRLFEHQKELSRRYWGKHLWARGYCVSTIGLDEEKIKKYVKWQQQKEQQG